MKNIYLTAGQLRAARALLRWPAEKLAEISGVSVVAIRRTETKDGPVTMMRANMVAIRTAIEAAGVQFIPENGGGAGVRLRKAAEARQP
jgi:transcriptional regulator with XRE-family HTH domain